MSVDTDHSTRIHIQFHHNGKVVRSTIPLVARRQDLKEFLNEIWSEFGTVTDSYYHRDFDYCVIQYETHTQAFFAMASLRDPIQVQAAVQNCVRADVLKDAMAKDMFVGDHPITADWAPPKTG